MTKSAELRDSMKHTECKIEIIEYLESRIHDYLEWRADGEDLAEWQIVQNEHYADCVSIMEKAIDYISAKL